MSDSTHSESRKLPESSTDEGSTTDLSPTVVEKRGTVSAPEPGVSRDALLVSNKSVIEDRTVDTEKTARPAQSLYSITLNDSAKLATTDRVISSHPLPQDEILKVGAKLGHFEITRFIGQGGMGRVYEARDTLLDRRVAIKVLHRHEARDTATAQRFANEARLAARLNHEHIAQVYFYGTENGIPYIAFEYVQGENLREYVDKHGVISLENSILFLIQIADALAHASNNGVTHRDVKPSNIIITPQQKTKLIDMGLARTFHADDPEEDLTVSGVTLGTYDYMSPEQAFNPRSADVRSDIYSLGCTFFFIMTGRPPYSDGKGLQKLLLHQEGRVPDICEFVPGTPESVSKILLKMMQRYPEDRYQTPEELIADLRVVAEQLGLYLQDGELAPVRLPETETVLLPHSGGLRQWFTYNLPWLSALVILGLVGGVFWFVGNEQKKSFVSGPLDDLEKRFSQSPSPEPQTSLGAHTADTAVSLSPYQQGARRRIRGLGTGETNRSEEMAVALEYPSRKFGGIGVASFSSNDILSMADAAGLSPEGAKLLEFTADSQSDTWTGGWSSVLKEESQGEKMFTESDPSFREGVDPIVDRKGKKDGCYATLDEAIISLVAWNRSVPAAQRHEVTIRLAFDGDMIASSLLLTDCTLKLVPVSGYSPRIVFRSDNASPGQAACLFTLRNAQLSVSGIRFFFDLRDQNIVSDSWTLIQFDSNSSVRLENVDMAIRNRDDDAATVFHPDVAFFRLTDGDVRPVPVGPHASDDTAGEGAVSAVVKNKGGNLVLAGGVYQGEAALVAVPGLMPLWFDVQQTVMLVDGPVLRCGEKDVGLYRETQQIRVSFHEVFCWTRSSLFRVTHKSPLSQGGDFGREITALLDGSFFVLSGNPVGEIVAPFSEQEPYHFPNWKMTENLFADSGESVRLTDLSGQTFNAPESDRDSSIQALFGNDNILLEMSPANFPFWNISREEVESAIFNPARKNLESEIGRQWLERLVSGIASR